MDADATKKATRDDIILDDNRNRIVQIPLVVKMSYGLHGLAHTVRVRHACNVAEIM